ncbi:MAG TPA: amidohydrolase [Woeseiaceae bacterium]|nr:amidohydrolase [Woeseiaceae bacterium]
MQSPLALRHALHTHPELSGHEVDSACRVREFFRPHEPDAVVGGLGGNGVAIVFNGREPGPTIMLRSELDALPIQEANRMPHRSQQDGIAHKCGHDGHAAILCAVGAELGRRRPQRGRVVLLFQPAEETGRGALAVVDDPKFAALRPDRVFGLHNLPGFPLGQVVVRAGTFTCASRGIAVSLRGRTAHAAQPETGRSPSAAMCHVIAELAGARERFGHSGELAFATIVGARLGERAFGVAPGTAEVWATLRAATDDTMAAMVRDCEQRVRAIAGDEQLQVETGYEDVFAATVNSARAVATVRAACKGLDVAEPAEPFRWSEDFGAFTRLADGAFFGLGAGPDSRALHDEHYDFPDALIDIGADVFLRIVATCLREPAP